MDQSLNVLERCIWAITETEMDCLKTISAENRLAAIDILSVLEVRFGKNNCFYEFIRLLWRSCVSDSERNHLCDQLQLETITSVGLLLSGPRTSSLTQKLIKVKTRTFYKQQKYNLLREESEGFSRLLVLLIAGQCRLESIRSMIGLYSLDPNRVLDLVLECLERFPQRSELYVAILGELVSDDDLIVRLLGFKIRNLLMGRDFDSDLSLFALAARCVLWGLCKDHEKITRMLARTTQPERCLYLLAEQLVVAQMDYPQGNGIAIVEQILDSAYLSPPSSTKYDEHSYLMDALSVYLETKHIDPIFGTKSAVAEFEQKLSETNVVEVLKLSKMIECHASRSPRLLTKIVGIGARFMRNVSDKASHNEFFEQLLVQLVLPSLTLLEGNEPLVLELWSWLGAYPYRLRFRIYGFWETHIYENSKDAIHAKRQQVLQKARYIIKRITRDNVKGFSRLLAKSSHCNPLVSLDYILQSIQRFDNFILPVVDALKYLSPLSYDVTLYLVIKALADSNKQQKKYTGTAFSPWLKSLCVFASSLLRKYNVDLAPAIDYVINQLKKRKCLDLLLLQELLEKMCGSEAFSGVTDHQLQCQGGGEVLRAEGGCFLSTNSPNQRNSRKSMQRLREVLMSDSRALDLCVLIAQMRDWVVFGNDPGVHAYPKFIGFLYDQCQNTLTQLLEFVGIPSQDQLVGLPADLGILVNRYRVAIDAAFMITRPAYNCFIQSKCEEFTSTAIVDDEDEEDEIRVKRECYVKACDHVMDPLKEVVKNLQVGKLSGASIVTKGGLKRDAEFWDSSCSFPNFYVTFWISRLYDIRCPSKAYLRQIESVKQSLAAIDGNSHKQRKERERLKDVLSRLEQEHATHQNHVELYKWRIQKEMEAWFVKKGQTKTEIITEFLQLCVFPRCVLSDVDAVFCAEFISILHTLKLPNFSTIICFDRTFTETMILMASCTECEAERFGRFLTCMLNVVMRWHGDKEIYDRECLLYPGFLTMFRHATASATAPAEKSSEEQLDYENFRHVCFKWHYTLTKSIVTCLESNDYPQVRNALKILTRLLSADYPRVLRLYENIEKKVEAISINQKDKRSDVCTLAAAYLGQLRNMRPNTVPEEMFHHKQPQQSASSSQQQQQQQQTPAPSETDQTTNGLATSTTTITPPTNISPILPKKRTQIGLDKPFFEAKRPARVPDLKR